jgi:hypothetical protein
MALWDSLNLVCFLIPVAGAISEARDVKTGVSGYALAIAIGIVLGITCTWIMWSVGERIGALVSLIRIQDKNDISESSTLERWFGCLSWHSLHGSCCRQRCEGSKLTA